MDSVNLFAYKIDLCEKLNFVTLNRNLRHEIEIWDTKEAFVSQN